MLSKNTTWKVARVFFDRPMQNHMLRAIARAVGLSHPAMYPHLDALKKAGIIKEVPLQAGNLKYSAYHADTESESFRLYKKLDMLERLTATGLTKEIIDIFAPTAIVLFGSASRGEDIHESELVQSDIDLFIQTSSKREPDLKKFEKQLNRKIQLHIKRDIKEYPKELQNNIANGITLYGFIEVVK